MSKEFTVAKVHELGFTLSVVWNPYNDVYLVIESGDTTIRKGIGRMLGGNRQDTHGLKGFAAKLKQLSKIVDRWAKVVDHGDEMDRPLEDTMQRLKRKNLLHVEIR